MDRRGAAGNPGARGGDRRRGGGEGARVQRPAGPQPAKGAGAVAGGLAASTVAEAARQIEPFAAGSSTLAAVFTTLTLAGLALSLGGLAYVWWSTRADARRAAVLDLLPAEGGQTEGAA
ncbi:hypothetical protein [Xanthobacter dioxanivorans]|uniref:hypothetical protein n=1 Tax=Xanthobacter dioxanivorans TaxID=2528964 RepID=UPI001E40D1CF|nr:hypothetical protein [Xanthobacter dioxanivorans]